MWHFYGPTDQRGGAGILMVVAAIFTLIGAVLLLFWRRVELDVIVMTATAAVATYAYRKAATGDNRTRTIAVASVAFMVCAMAGVSVLVPA
jgi:hypothetical protein